MSAIEVLGLVKAYGPVPALRGITLRVEPGEIYGLLGRNGAGKSSLVKILLSLVRPSGGSARLLGSEVSRPESRRRVGYLPEEPGFPEYHTGRTALDFYGELSGLARSERRRRIPELLARLDLQEAGARKLRTYSKGMKQRLGLAQAILHDPDVLLLDEATDGVDVEGRSRIRDLLAELRSRGKTILLNSHLLGEVERLCDRVGILESGRLVREGSVQALTKPENVYTLRTEGGAEGLPEALAERWPGARQTADGFELPLAGPGELDRVIDFLRARGVGIRGVTEKRISLEDVFRDTLP
ncbi:MAG TPA: ABC transporter ATP-binding protein [Planctomycetota bacterium]|nr:ABC transporter ATP-binding protein [Planctomycetota bacterium]